MVTMKAWLVNLPAYCAGHWAAAERNQQPLFNKTVGDTFTAAKAVCFQKVEALEKSYDSSEVGGEGEGTSEMSLWACVGNRTKMTGGCMILAYRDKGHRLLTWPIYY